MIKRIIKNTLKIIKENKLKFILLVTIISLFIGILFSFKFFSNILKQEIKKYYEKNNYFDISITSDIGFLSNDKKILKNLNFIKDIDLYKTFNSTININSNKKDIKVISLNNSNYVNKPILISGNYPNSVNEAVVEERLLKDNYISIGDLLTLNDENNELKAKKIKIVGTVENQYLLNNKNKYNIYLNEYNFHTSYYSTLYIRIKNNEICDKYISNYSSIIDKTLSPILNERYSYLNNKIDDDIDITTDILNRLYNISYKEKELNNYINEYKTKLNNQIKYKNNLKTYKTNILTRNNYLNTNKLLKNIYIYENFFQFVPILSLIIIILTLTNEIFILIKKDKKEMIYLKIKSKNFNIAVIKYLLYILLIILISLLIGNIIIKNIINFNIWNIFNKLYNIPKYSFNFSYNLVYIIIIIFFTFVSTFIIFYKNNKINIKKVKVLSKNKFIKLILLKTLLITSIVIFLVSINFNYKFSFNKTLCKININYELLKLKNKNSYNFTNNIKNIEYEKKCIDENFTKINKIKVDKINKIEPINKLMKLIFAIITIFNLYFLFNNVSCTKRKIKNKFYLYTFIKLIISLLLGFVLGFLIGKLYLNFII